MRRIWQVAGLLAMAHGALCANAQQIPPPIPAGQLVREVVYNELRDHERHGYWQYWVQRRIQQQTQLVDQVETAQGPIGRLVLSNGQPLSAEAEQQEQARLQHLLTSAAEQAKHFQAYEDDENRIGRILALLPEAFLYVQDGDENGCHRLRFHPNPDYPAHTIEARIFHAMSGTIWIDARLKRLVRLDARVEENVDFGYGILGRIYKGGWYQLKRTQVSPTDWKTDRLEVHMNGRALLVKTFARETSEARGGFLLVPTGMNLGQGMALLEKSQAHTIAGAPLPTESKAAALAPAGLALRP
jgi:hypothetical protein